MAEDLADSWEVADLDASMSRLMLSKLDSSSNLPSTSSSSTSPPELVDVSASASATSRSSPGVVTEELVNSVDQFLREALQNPRERLSVLRMEQDVEKFIRDPTQQQMEFQQLPTSYLRLAAHRVAQHYSLQSMVLLDNTLPDGSGSRIIIRKTTECRLPLIRLADIPVTLPTEDTTSSVVKVAIKQRPQKRSQNANSGGSHSSRANSSKSVEERKEEYNRARARIFSSSTSGSAGGKPETEPRAQELFQHSSLGISKIEEVTVPVGTDVNIGRGSIDSSTGSSRSARSRIEKEPVGRFRTNNRVAIFRDREVERKDPDYDRSYDRLFGVEDEVWVCPSSISFSFRLNFRGLGRNGDKALLWQCGLLYMDRQKRQNFQGSELVEVFCGIGCGSFGWLARGAFRGVPLSVIQRDWNAVLF